jgi:hypothetical protein
VYLGLILRYNDPQPLKLGAYIVSLDDHALA